jgi:hypothetical protein
LQRAAKSRAGHEQLEMSGNDLTKNCIPVFITRNLKRTRRESHLPMNEYSPQVQSAQNFRRDAEQRFGLFDLALFVLGHVAVPTTRSASESDSRPQRPSIWKNQPKPDRLAAHKVFGRIHSRLETLWSLPLYPSFSSPAKRPVTGPTIEAP